MNSHRPLLLLVITFAVQLSQLSIADAAIAEPSSDYAKTFEDKFGGRLALNENGARQSEGLAFLRKTHEECRLISPPSFCVGLKGELTTATNCDFKTAGNEEKCLVIVKVVAYYQNFDLEPDLNFTIATQAKYPQVAMKLYIPEYRKPTTLFCNRNYFAGFNQTNRISAGPFSTLKRFFVLSDEHYCTWSYEHRVNVRTWISRGTLVSISVIEKFTIDISNLGNSTWPFYTDQQTMKPTAVAVHQTTSSTTTTVLSEKPEQPETTKKRRCKLKSGTPGAIGLNGSTLVILFLVSLYFS